MDQKESRNHGVAASQLQTVEQTARELRQQLSTTGAYRPQDLQRVFGDPRNSVSFAATSDYCSCHRHK